MGINNNFKDKPAREVVSNPLFKIEKSGQIVSIFFEEEFYAEFRGVAVTHYENGILITPTAYFNHENGFRRYCFINNNGDRLFNFDKKVDEQTHKSLENVEVDVGKKFVTVTRTPLYGLTSQKIYNVESGERKTFSDNDQLSIFDV